MNTSSEKLICYSGTLVITYQTSQCHNPEDNRMNAHCHENLKLCLLELPIQSEKDFVHKFFIL
jgi:hypothetical protein